MRCRASVSRGGGRGLGLSQAKRAEGGSPLALSVMTCQRDYPLRPPRLSTRRDADLLALQALQVIPLPSRSASLTELAVLTMVVWHLEQDASTTAYDPSPALI